MANIQKRPNGKWRARYRDSTGKEYSRHFARKVDAQRWLDEVTTSLVTGQYVDPKSAKTPFRDYAERWRLAQPHRPNTARLAETYLRLYIYPRWASRGIGSIKPGDVQRWIVALSAENGLAASTIRTVYNTLNAVMRAAVRDRLAASNPCEGAKLPKVPPKRIVPLTVEQVQALAAGVPAQYRALVLLGAATGLRPGELFGLQLRHLDLFGRSVTVDQQILRAPKRGTVIGEPKTARSHRVVPLPEMAVRAMKEHLRAFPPGEDGWLFTAPEGGPVAYTPFMEWAWRPLAKKLGFPPRTGPHALRHHYASLLIRNGESVKTVSERLGHTNAAMTLNIYIHLWPDSEDRTRAAVDRAYGLADGSEEEDRAA
ncbi:site-specific integrase [Mangrovactinospora gilvigrisea]|uniref:Site-specific integrase n=1 Tax=Mangrovactinospora gilvigrisea TaxID=1428644 RepID=A0A1J7BJB6_9ACTN|nr:site-specific integrase [Mangrovactinospora gilvigrisea]OIV38775.1 site-specific integrase [Mangrovactinospora gilvigrisea]